MNRRWVGVWLALVAVAIAVAMAVVIALAASSTPWPEDADAVFVLAGLAPALVGSVLVVRRPENAIGMLLVLIGALWLVAETSRIYLWMSLFTDLPAIGVAAWCVAWMFAPAWMLIPLLLTVYPTGRVASTWMRRPVRFYVAFLAFVALWGMVSPTSLDGYGGYLADFSNPLGVEALATYEDAPLVQAADIASIGSVLSMVLLSIVDLIQRWRRSHGVERLQIRAFALGAFTMVLLFGIGAAMAAGNVPKLLENLTTTLALSSPALAVGLAILRYRLYEIDRIVSRTVSYALVAGLLAGVFAVIAVGLPRLAGVPEENPVLVAAATLAVAALFNPLRRRVQGWVDRRFNRARYDARREVEHFSERLRAEVEMDDLTNQVVDVVSKTVQPDSVAVWVRAQT